MGHTRAKMFKLGHWGLIVIWYRMIVKVVLFHDPDWWKPIIEIGSTGRHV